jgi:mono/diheme cytochrome c family protein
MANKKFFLFAATVLFGSAALISCNKTAGTGTVEDADSDPVKRGEYIVKITGCNDCHTPGYPEADGNLPVEEWLREARRLARQWEPPMLSTSGFYAGLTKTWLEYARSARRPPMPWTYCAISRLI